MAAGAFLAWGRLLGELVGLLGGSVFDRAYASACAPRDESGKVEVRLRDAARDIDKLAQMLLDEQCGPSYSPYFCP